MNFSAMLTANTKPEQTACTSKADAASKLQRLGDRLQILAGPRRSGAEFEAWLQRHPGGDSLVQAWRKLSGIARRLADANKVNGALLEVREQQVRSACDRRRASKVQALCRWTPFDRLRAAVMTQAPPRFTAE